MTYLVHSLMFVRDLCPTVDHIVTVTVKVGPGARLPFLVVLPYTSVKDGVSLCPVTPEDGSRCETEIMTDHGTQNLVMKDVRPRVVPDIDPRCLSPSGPVPSWVASLHLPGFGTQSERHHFTILCSPGGQVTIGPSVFYPLGPEWR